MFVPCDEDGNVLEEPKISCATCKKCTCSFEYAKNFDKAKEKVLFKGFEISTNKQGEKVVLGDYTCLKVKVLSSLNIESLTKYINIKLTESAIIKL